MSKEEELTIAEFHAVWDELCATEDDLVLRGTRLIIPTSMRRRYVGTAHEGHLGTAKTKNLIRFKTWFQGLDKMVEECLKSCHPCQLLDGGVVREPIKPTEMPDSEYLGVAHKPVTPEWPNTNGLAEAMVLQEGAQGARKQTVRRIRTNQSGEAGPTSQEEQGQDKSEGLSQCLGETSRPEREEVTVEDQTEQPRM